MKGSFSQRGSTSVFLGCFERCTLFFSPLVTKPFDSRVCVFSTLLSPPCLAHSSCFIRVELTRTEIISCSRHRIFVTESKGWLPVLLEAFDPHFHLSVSPPQALPASGPCPTALCPTALSPPHLLHTLGFRLASQRPRPFASLVPPHSGIFAYASKGHCPSARPRGPAPFGPPPVSPEGAAVARRREDAPSTGFLPAPCAGYK